MKTIICLIIICITCIVVIKMCFGDKMHDLVIKIGNCIYIDIKENGKE